MWRVIVLLALMLNVVTALPYPLLYGPTIPPELIQNLGLLQPPQPTLPCPSSFNVTAIAGRDGKTIFQCWQFQAPLMGIMEHKDDKDPLYHAINPGEAGGSVTFASASPGVVASPHPTPNKQYVHFPSLCCTISGYSSCIHPVRMELRGRFAFITSGTCRFSIPSTGEAVEVEAGRRSLVITVDTKEVTSEGHISEFVDGQHGSLVMVPFAKGKEPDHTVLYDGACKAEDQREW